MDLLLQQHRQQICQEICRDNASYETLDATRWLNALEEEKTTPVAVPPTDTYHKVTSPWRRFFARHFDLFLYSAIWMMLGFLLLSEGPSTESGAGWMGAANIIAIIMMVLVEPLLLSTWGTTPGKWLLGLSVRNNTGSKLTYSDGTNTVEFKYSAEASAKSGVSTYVALVDAAIAMENFVNEDYFSVSDGDAATVSFGDTNGDGIINAQDALTVVDTWLRKGEEPANDQILTMNVNGDSRINTFDALGIVEKFVSGSEYGVVLKAATITTNP
jgi:hypothetical protein